MISIPFMRALLDRIDHDPSLGSVQFFASILGNPDNVYYNPKLNVLIC